MRPYTFSKDKLIVGLLFIKSPETWPPIFYIHYR